VQLRPGVGELGLEAIAGVRLCGAQSAQGGVDLPGEIANDLGGEDFLEDELEECLFKPKAVDLTIVLADDRSAIAMGGATVVLARVDRVGRPAGAALEQAAEQILEPVHSGRRFVFAWPAPGIDTGTIRAELVADTTASGSVRVDRVYANASTTGMPARSMIT